MVPVLVGTVGGGVVVTGNVVVVWDGGAVDGVVVGVVVGGTVVCGGGAVDGGGVVDGAVVLEVGAVVGGAVVGGAVVGGTVVGGGTVWATAGVAISTDNSTGSRAATTGRRPRLVTLVALSATKDDIL